MENIIRKVFLYLLMACTFIAASFICVTRLFVTVDFPINMDSNYVSCLYYFFDFPSIIFGLILLAISLFLFYKLKIHEYVKTIHIEIFIFLWVCIVGILTKELFKMQAFEDGYFILYAANAFLDGGKEVYLSIEN